MADEHEKGSEEPVRSNEDGAETQKDTAPPQEAVVQQMEANEDGEGDGLSQQRKRKASQEIVESDTNTGGTTTPVRDSPRPFYHITNHDTLQAFFLSQNFCNHFHLRN